MRVAVLTSTDVRHRYFVNALRAKFPVAAAGYEQTGYNQSTIDTSDLTPNDAAAVQAHFDERVRQEAIFFGHDAEYCDPRISTLELRNPNEHTGTYVSPSNRHIAMSSKAATTGTNSPDRPASCAVRLIPPNQLNTPATVDFLLSQEADTVIVFGTNLIKPPLLGRWPGRMINMHLGLSPYYRGTATNFYPLLNLEPQFVGATIHYIDAGIDTGPILQHARPTLKPHDMPHVIGCNAIAAGIEAVIKILHKLDGGRRLDGAPQWTVPNPRLYLRKHYHQRQVVELYRKIEQGLLREAIVKSLIAQPPRLVTD